MGIGGGILFLLALMTIGAACLIWIAIWLPKGFRSRRQGDAARVKRLSSATFCGIALLMFCFPPLRDIGEWAIEGTNTIVAPGNSLRPDDRGYFGYIPTYAWMGHSLPQDMRQSPSRVVVERGEERIELSSVRRSVDWLFLFSQLGVLSLFFLPYLAARDETLIANPRTRDKRPSFEDFVA